jgi:hypothetical protein
VSGAEAQTRIRRAAVVAGPAVAVVGGYGAFFLGEALSGPLALELDALMAHSRVPLEGRDEIRRVVAALRAAGLAWRHGKPTDFQADSRAETGSVGEQAASNGGVPLHVRDVAPLLELSDRRVRGLAAAGRLRGRRDARGQWWFSRADVEAERERRGLVAVTGGRQVA